MNILCQILYDRSGEPLYVIFEHGNFSRPIAIISHAEAKVIQLSVTGEETRRKLIQESA